MPNKHKHHKKLKETATPQNNNLMSTSVASFPISSMITIHDEDTLYNALMGSESTSDVGPTFGDYASSRTAATAQQVGNSSQQPDFSFIAQPSPEGNPRTRSISLSAFSNMDFDNVSSFGMLNSLGSLGTDIGLLASVTHGEEGQRVDNNVQRNPQETDDCSWFPQMSAADTTGEGSTDTDVVKKKRKRSDWLGIYRKALSTTHKLASSGGACHTVTPLPPSVAFARGKMINSLRAPTFGDEEQHYADKECSATADGTAASPNKQTRRPTTKRRKKSQDGTQSKTKTAQTKASTSRRDVPVTARSYLETQEPGSSDVLGGRGGGANHHQGNERYWREILLLRPTYQGVGKRDNLTKNQLARRVLEHIHASGGRFLERERSSRRLYVIPDDCALSKIKQAFRDKYVPLFARDDAP